MSGLDINLKTFLYWGVAALALVALAGPMPDLATVLVIILLVGVLITHASTFLPMLAPPTA